MIRKNVLILWKHYYIHFLWILKMKNVRLIINSCQNYLILLKVLFKDFLLILVILLEELSIYPDKYDKLIPSWAIS